ncbi:MAG: hypothetical protein P1S60_10255 [Anaerolineae bacterium]|nr:hypothetical protein [Anaerolineae bacterium]
MDPWFVTNYEARVITEEKLFEVYRKMVRTDGRRFLPTLVESLLGIF